MAALVDPGARLAHLERLLCERKLDRTLSSVRWPVRQDERAAFEIPPLDRALGGGLPRGQMSEIAGPASSGRTSLAWAWLGAATRRGEAVALVDTFDRFDPASGETRGIDLTRLLWIRGQAITKTAGALDPAWLPGVRAVHGPGTLVERAIDRALKALNVVLQSGVCTAVVLDVADVPLAGVRRLPAATWLRMQRVIDGQDTTCLLVGPAPLARSADGVSIRVGKTGGSGGTGRGAAPGVWQARGPGRVRWSGTHDRARRFAGFALALQIVSSRRGAGVELAIG
jgi:hypothetical protein